MSCFRHFAIIAAFILPYQLDASEPAAKRRKVEPTENESTNADNFFYADPVIKGVSQFLTASEYWNIRALSKSSNLHLNALKKASPFYRRELDKMVQEINLLDCAKNMPNFESKDSKLAQMFVEFRIIELLENEVSSFLGQDSDNDVPSVVSGLRRRRLPFLSNIQPRRLPSNVTVRLSFDRLKGNYTQLMRDYGANPQDLVESEQLGGGFLLLVPHELNNDLNANHDENNADTPRVGDFENWVKNQVKEGLADLTKGELDSTYTRDRNYLMRLAYYISMGIRNNDRYQEFVEALSAWISDSRSREFPEETQIKSVILDGIDLNNTDEKNIKKINFVLSIFE